MIARIVLRDLDPVAWSALEARQEVAGRQTTAEEHSGG